MDATHTSKRPRAGKEEDDDDAGGGGEGRHGLLPWHNPAARICRVSRASGGKDRHSKVLTAKGLRDRRVRLSVSTAIQFYDLQDRLGYDQPSKAVEWLIRAASAAIEELPSLDSAFAELSSRLLTAKHARNQQSQHVSVTKSTCSSNSETSKGSVLSLSRSETRTKAWERAKERSTREKMERDNPQDHGAGAASHCSFTDLLTGSNLVTVAQADAGFAHRHSRAVTADYFRHDGEPQKPPHLPGIAQFTNGGIMPFGFAPLTAGDHAEIQHQLPFLQDHLVPVAAVANGGDYNLNFSISSGLAGFNRGTLQSNSPSLMAHFHHLQRFSSQADVSNLPFVFGAAVPGASASSGENLFPSGIDGRLHISYGDAYRHSDLKGKGKN